MSETTHLMLPFILAAQAQKHVTHNEALRLLDGLVQLAVLDRTRTAPPASPADGDRHIVASGATGLWTGWDLNVAYWVDGAWLRLVPRHGWLAWIAYEEVLLAFDGAAWIEAGGGGGGVSLPELADGSVGALGVNTGADATNRLAVRSNSVLFTAINAGDGGNGDMRYVVNKESPTDTASFLFQSAWSGRAEFGLVGNDLFGVKVSPDGSVWNSAFSVTGEGRIITEGSSAFATQLGTVPVTPKFQVLSSGADASFLMARFSNDAHPGRIFLAKSRSAGGVGSHGSVVNGDFLGEFSFAGSDGTKMSEGARITVRAAGAPGSNYLPTTLSFATSTGTSAPAVTVEAQPDGGVTFPRIGTTAASANASLNAADGNNLLRSTSSGRYKRDVEPVERARSDAILALEPVWYRSTAAADNPHWSWYGLIAEDVAKVEPRLVHYGYLEDDYDLVPDEDGDGHRRVLKKDATLKPDGVQYDRLVVLLLDVVKRQEERIAALEARLGRLEPPR
jgi:hypothetical protein